jgi:hypothetical protein
LNGRKIGRSSAPKTRIDWKKNWGTHHPKTSKTTTQKLETLWEISNWGLLYLKFSGEKIGLGDLDDSTLKLVVTIIQPEW